MAGPILVNMEVGHRCRGELSFRVIVDREGSPDVFLLGVDSKIYGAI